MDYIGPGFDPSSLPADQLTLLTNRPYAHSDRLRAAAGLTPTSLAGLFRDAKESIGSKKYDVMFMEFSRAGGLMATQLSVRTKVCCLHNVEADYFARSVRGIRRCLTPIVRRSEHASLLNSDVLLPLHSGDWNRFSKLYPTATARKMAILHPVCAADSPGEHIDVPNRTNTIAFVGSLDCHFNVIGLKEFLQKVWSRFCAAGWTLLIIGRNPDAGLRRFVNQFSSVELIPNPNDVGEHLRKAKLLVVPDITGTGMKVRIADAMSVGVPVLGTHRALAGYDDASEWSVGVDSVDEMVSALYILTSAPETIETMAWAALQAGRRRYSFAAFQARLHSVFDAVL